MKSAISDEKTTITSFFKNDIPSKMTKKLMILNMATKDTVFFILAH